MTNLLAVVLVTMATNVSNVQIHENCPACDTDPAHPEVAQWPLPYPPPPLPLSSPRPVRQETTEIIETSIITFEWQGTARVLPFHNRVVERVVRRYKTKTVEEELKPAQR